MFSSNPYVVYMRTGFTVAADVLYTYKGVRVDKTLLLSAQSLSDQLILRMAENNDSLIGIEVWVYKSGAERMSKYLVED